MDEFLVLMRMSFLIAMPQAFAYLLFVMSFLQPLPRNLFRRIALLVVIHSLYTDAMQLVLPLPIHFINSLAAQAVLYWLFFRELSIRKKIMVFLFMNLFAVLMDLFAINVIQNWFHVASRDEAIGDKWLVYAVETYVQIVVILTAAWRIQRLNPSSFKRFFFILTEGNRSVLNKLIVLIVTQFLLLGSLYFVEFADESNKAFTSAVITYLVVAVSFAILVFIFRLLIGTRDSAVRMTQGVYVGDIKDMFASIRGQRHEFIKHLETIHWMAQAGKTGELQLYVKELVRETREVSEIVNHRFPALAAFVQAKTAVAVAKSIAFSFELPDGQGNRETSVRIIDIVRILGNLVDNAFDEVMSMPAEQRRVNASVQYDENNVVLEVTNGGRVLTQAEKDKMFAPGYTTKTDGEHSGLGLAIVMERTCHYGGTIGLNSDEENGTSFKIMLPNEPATSG